MLENGLNSSKMGAKKRSCFGGDGVRGARLGAYKAVA